MNKELNYEITWGSTSSSGGGDWSVGGTDLKFNYDYWYPYYEKYVYIPTTYTEKVVKVDTTKKAFDIAKMLMKEGVIPNKITVEKFTRLVEKIVKELS